MSQPIPQKLQPWIEARNRFHLSHAHVQMARELGMNPRKLGKLANHRQEPWKLPLPEFIEKCYFKNFGKRQPDNVRSVEQMAKDQTRKRMEQHARKEERRKAAAAGDPLEFAEAAERLARPDVHVEQPEMQVARQSTGVPQQIGDDEDLPF